MTDSLESLVAVESWFAGAMDIESPPLVSSLTELIGAIVSDHRLRR